MTTSSSAREMLGATVAHGARLLADVLEGHGHGGVAVEGHLAGEHFVKHDADGVEVALFVGHLAGGLFGREVVHAAQRRVLLVVHAGGLGGFQARDAEIGHLDLAILASTRMFWGLMSRWTMPFLWAWSTAARMRMTMRTAVSGAMRPCLADELLERLAGDVLHDDIAHVVVLAHIQKVDDVFVRHLGRGLGFAAEAAHKFLVLLVFRAQDLDGDGALF